MNHIVLAGDSIFDNAAYVAQGLAVVNQLNDKAPGINATLLAVVGSVTSDLGAQLEQLPQSTTHLFISSGGNDAHESAHLLAKPVSTVTEAMSLFVGAIGQFQYHYHSMVQNAMARVENVVVCTVYDSIPGYETESLTALKLFNEVILREAFSFRLPVIDLRLICNHPKDYSAISPIEPSEQGGDKISAAILDVVRSNDFSKNYSSIWV
jgi:hypothetical protein